MRIFLHIINIERHSFSLYAYENTMRLCRRDGLCGCIVLFYRCYVMLSAIQLDKWIFNKTEPNKTEWMAMGKPFPIPIYSMQIQTHSHTHTHSERAICILSWSSILFLFVIIGVQCVMALYIPFCSFFFPWPPLFMFIYRILHSLQFS